MTHVIKSNCILTLGYIPYVTNTLNMASQILAVMPCSEIIY